MLHDENFKSFYIMTLCCLLTLLYNHFLEWSGNVTQQFIFLKLVNPLKRNKTNCNISFRQGI